MKFSHNFFAMSLAIAAMGVAPIMISNAIADDEVNVASGGTLQGPGVAVHGYDVISYHSGTPTVGNPEFSLAYEGATYRFASKKNLEIFKVDPAKYVPAYGGFCAFGVALGKKFDGNPKFWKIVDNRLYLNLNNEIQSKWSKDIKGNIKKSEAKWGDIRSVAAKKL
ncbi:MAG: YHS domain-containing (seleno)protein [Methyloligellaceae bacterium]